MGCLRFGEFEFDLSAYELRGVDGEVIHLQPQQLRLLAILLQSPQRLLTREELRQKLWADDTHVDYDRSLNFCVKKVREALADDAKNPRYVETVPRLGYRFVATVRQHQRGSSPSAGKPWWRRVEAKWAASALALGLLGLGLLTSRARPSRDDVAPARHTLAVLPFVDATGEPGQEYLGEILATAVSERLTRIDPRRLAIVSGPSTSSFAEEGDDPRAVAEKLGADHVVYGTIVRRGSERALQATLARVRDDTVLWTERFEDVDAPDAIATRITASVAAPIVAERGAESMIPALEDDYWVGRYLAKKATPEALARAVSVYERIIDHRPDFAPAYGALADALLRLGMVSRPPEAGEYLRRAEIASRTGLRLDPRRADALAARAMTVLLLDFDWTGAESAFLSALELEPGRAETRRWYAFYLAAAGRSEDALDQSLLAHRLNPLDPWVTLDTGWYYYLARRFPEAIAMCRRALELEPDDPSAGLCVQYSQLMDGRSEDAVRTRLDRLAEAGLSETDLSEARLAAGEGLRGLWNWELATYEGSVTRGGYACLAAHQAATGRTRAALDSLETAFSDRESWIYFLRTDPLFDSIRNEPRFRALLDRIGPS